MNTIKLTCNVLITIRLNLDKDLTSSEIDAFAPYEDEDKYKDNRTYYLKYSKLPKSDQLMIYMHITDYLKDLHKTGKDKPNESGHIIEPTFLVNPQTGIVEFESMFKSSMTQDQIKKQLDVEFTNGYGSVGIDNISLDVIMMLPKCFTEIEINWIFSSIHISTN